MIKAVFTDGAAIMFGSSSNGLGFKWSDVDVSLEFNIDAMFLKHNETQIQEKIVKIVEESSEFHVVKIISHSSIPVIKIVHIHTGILCDLSFSNRNITVINL